MPRINVSRNVFDDAIRHYRRCDLQPADLALLEWFWGYAFNELGGDQQRAAEAVGYD